jgi:hypothetical protein
VDLGLLEVRDFNEADDPWVWINQSVSGTDLTEDIGLLIYDSATSESEALLGAAAKLSARGTQVGSQKILKFSIPGTGLTIGANTESHYMVVQSFMLDAIWKSTWLSRRGVNVLWTFGEHRGENPNDSPIVGPKLAGKALTGSIPKWLRYTLRLESVPVEGGATRHILHLQEKPELNGLGMSFGNSRYPLDADTPLPASLEPASVPEFLRLIAQGQEEAKAKLKAEFNL